MRYADIVIKALSLVAFAVLFVLFLRCVSGFGENATNADLTDCNILMVIMILLMFVSAISSLAFDFYEKNKWQNEQIFSSLNQKINSLEKLENRINQITAEYGKKMELLHEGLANKVAENTAKLEEYMTQFANLSVQVFSKDKQTQNMQHDIISDKAVELSGDYFNHYTEENPKDTTIDAELEVLQLSDKVEFDEEPKVLIPEDKIDIEEPEVLQLSDKVEFEEEPEVLTPEDQIDIILPDTAPETNGIKVPENVEVSADLDLSADNLSENLIEDILNGQKTAKDEAQQTDADNLSTIFNDELAQTLAGLEIMKDEEKFEPEEIDLSAYFSDEEKIKL